MKNYVDRVVDRLQSLLSDCPIELLRLYALVGLVSGPHICERDVHDAWAVWRTTNYPDHPDLLPYDLLTQDVKAKDRPYVLAIWQAVEPELTTPSTSEER